MSTNPSGEAGFCPGCPAEGTYLGEVTEDAVNYTLTDVYDWKRYKSVDATVSFTTDEFSGSSETVRRSMLVAPNKAAGLQSRVEAERADLTIPTILIKRIGKCSQVCIDDDGKRYCRAFNGAALGELLETTLKET